MHIAANKSVHHRRLSAAFGNDLDHERGRLRIVPRDSVPARFPNRKRRYSFPLYIEQADPAVRPRYVELNVFIPPADKYFSGVVTLTRLMFVVTILTYLRLLHPGRCAKNQVH